MADNALWDFSFHVEYSENDIWKHPIAYTHFHKIYEIYYLIENEIVYFIDDKTYHIPEGTVVIVPPYKIHTTRGLNDRCRKRLLIYIPESFVECYLRDDPNLLKRLETAPFTIKQSKRKSIEDLMFKLLNEYQKNQGSIVLQKALLGELLVNLYRLSIESAKETGSRSIRKGTGQIQSITNYITSHYYSDISLESLSKKFFMHPSYISRAFKQQLNISFTDFLKSVRIREVTLLLQSSELSVMQIAEKTGFDSSTSLCRAFKSVMGTTPLQYRKSYKNNVL